MEWKTVTAEQFCTRVTDGTHDSPKRQEVGRYLITSKHLSGSDIDFSSAYKISEEDYQKIIVRSNVEQYDILFSMIGTIGNTYRVTEEAVDYAVKNMAIFKFGGNKGDSSWFYYWLKSPQAQAYISQMQAGSTQGYLTLATLRSFPVAVPDHATQDKIVAILSSLDDKIENNNRINRNLEAQAQALFKSWFVDFEPFGGVLPEDWEETTIGEICKCYLGGTPSRAKAEYWNGEIPWINSGEVNKYRILEGSEYITELGLQKSATKLLPRKTTVLAITGATLGQVSLLEIEACANQSVIGIVQNEKVPYEFIYPLILKDIEQIMLHQTGGAQQHINKDNVESHKLILPTDEVMAKYKAIQAPLFETIANNCFESQRLATLRDTLLPKLMKGEIAL